MSIKFWVFFILPALAFDVGAEIKARYNFNGRVGKGREIRRDEIDGGLKTKAPHQGPDYVPDPTKGEKGPVLINTPGGKTNYYRSFYWNPMGGLDHEALRMKISHAHYIDGYQSKPDKQGQGVLPATGSFTWEISLLLKRTFGPSSGGVPNINTLIDATVYDVPDKKNKNIRIAALQSLRADQKTGTWDLRFMVPKDHFGHTNSIIVKGLVLNRFYRIVAVYEDLGKTGKIRLYVDGQLKAEAETTRNTARNTNFGIDRFAVGNKLHTARAGASDIIIDEIVLTDDVRSPENFVIKSK